MIDYARNVAIKSHATSQHLPGFEEDAWQKSGQDKYNGGEAPFRTCSYCGSIHPLDLLIYLEKGKADLSGADWKHGWPHKFYCDLPNPHEDAMVQVGSKYQGGEEVVVLGKASPFIHTKFYNVHLNDLEDEEFTSLANALFVYTGILFERKEAGKLWYSAPHAGYQAWGTQATLFHKFMREGVPPEQAMARAAQALREGMQQNAEH